MVYLAVAFIIFGNGLDLLEQTIVSDHILVNFLRADLGTHPWPLSVVFFLTFTMYQYRDISYCNKTKTNALNPSTVSQSYRKLSVVSRF